MISEAYTEFGKKVPNANAEHSVLQVEKDSPAEEAGAPADDPVKAMVARAFESALASHSGGASGGKEGAADAVAADAVGAEEQDGDEQGGDEQGDEEQDDEEQEAAPQQHQIRVTRDMHQALFLVNNLLVGVPDDNPSFLMRMNPEKFEEDLCALFSTFTHAW
jgi:hypothetical protein